MNAIVAAGVTFQVTRACTMGDLLECSCDKNLKKRSRNKHHQQQQPRLGGKDAVGPPMPEGEWEWGGCGDNINFGLRKSKDFMDIRYRRRSDMKTLVKLHNYAAGRLVSKNLQVLVMQLCFISLYVTAAANISLSFV